MILLFTIIRCNKDPNQASTCEITAPTIGQEFLIGELVLVTMDTEDSDGNITEVKFYIDSIEKNTSTNFPYSYNWATSNESIGSHTIKVISYDNDGVSSSDEISIILIGGTGQSCPGIPTITDYDGNSYNTVLIGSQCWMAENLATSHYANGIAIPNVTSNSAWDALVNNNTDDAYCYFDNSSTNADIYGALYTWAAAMGDNALSSSTNPSGVQGACPMGWHLPSDNEWKQLEMQLGMSQSEADDSGYRGIDQGSQLAGNSSLWLSYSLVNSTQFGTSGFTALPGGYRDGDYYGSFYNLGGLGYWWTASGSGVSTAWSRWLDMGDKRVFRYKFASKAYGYSVRCLKNN